MEEFDLICQDKLTFALFGYIIKQVPNEAFIDCSDYLALLKRKPVEKHLPIEILKWEIPCQNYYEPDSVRIELNEECKKYLHSNILRVSGFLCHFTISDAQKTYVSVYDGCHFDIDKSIKIPQRVLDECESMLEMDFRFSNTVTP